MLKDPAWWSVRRPLLLALGALLLVCAGAWVGALSYATEKPPVAALQQVTHLLSYAGR